MVFPSEIKYYLILCGKCGKLINKWQDPQLFQQRFQVIIGTTLVFLHRFHVEFLGVQWLETHPELMPSHQLSHYKDRFFPPPPFQSATDIPTAVKLARKKEIKNKKTHYQFHLFPQLYPHLNYGCLTYCMEREIKQTDEGTSQGDMWVSVESQAG